ncbi:hypothetical protein MYX77_01125 [Acidobacteriia bacterium AH_259_A11_L15]|nr:hypothetical protein [Acidobacteriia bacterium AH_259_A11_L15]
MKLQTVEDAVFRKRISDPERREKNKGKTIFCREVIEMVAQALVEMLKEEKETRFKKD